MNLQPKYLLLLSFIVISCSQQTKNSYSEKVIVTEEKRTSTPNYKFENGKWFDGKGFIEKTFYSSGNKLTETAPFKIDSIIGLDGNYVIPPLGEGHMHNLNNIETIDDEINNYLSKGIYYVMVQDALFEIKEDILKKINKPSSVDVIHAQGVVIAPWYNLLQNLHAHLLERGEFGDRTKISELDTREIFLIETMDDLNLKWDLLAAKNTDIIKVLLAFSDEFEERKLLSDGVRPGIDPKLLRPIVERAHSAGLRVSLHIETAADFHFGVEAGVDIIAHLPGWRIGTDAGYDSISIDPWLISQDDARMAAEKGIIQITTSLPKQWLPGYPNNLERLKKIHSHNLKLLNDNGVIIAIGTDSRSESVTDELKNLKGYGIFDNLTLLKMAVETTPKAIFPKRMIGKLEEGYEASFLVLNDNPIEALTNMMDIRLSVKEGYIMNIDRN